MKKILGKTLTLIQFKVHKWQNTWQNTHIYQLLSWQNTPPFIFPMAIKWGDSHFRCKKRRQLGPDEVTKNRPETVAPHSWAPFYLVNILLIMVNTMVIIWLMMVNSNDWLVDDLPL